MIRIEIPGPRILALDIATHTGWSVPEASGVLDLSLYSGDYRAMGWSFSKALADLIVEHAPERVVIERPIGAHGLYLLNGLVFLAHMVCYGHEIPSSDVRADDWRRGLGMPARRKVKAGEHKDILKHRALAYVRSLGHAPRDDNEADAICIRLWAERQYSMTEAA